MQTAEEEIPNEIYDKLFFIGMWWRICYGSVRLLVGFVFLRLVGTPLSEIFYRLMSHEYARDPGDIFLRFIDPFLKHHGYTVTYFLASYLIFWGAIDVVLSINLLQHKIWAFKSSLYLITLFTAYEFYRFLHTHSFILLWIIFFDIFILWVIYEEYLRQLARIEKRLKE